EGEGFEPAAFSDRARHDSGSRTARRTHRHHRRVYGAAVFDDFEVGARGVGHQVGVRTGSADTVDPGGVGAASDYHEPRRHRLSPTVATGRHVRARRDSISAPLPTAIGESTAHTTASVPIPPTVDASATSLEAQNMPISMVRVRRVNK